MENTEEKVCPNCGKKLFGYASFCDLCGTKINMDAKNTETVVNVPTFWNKNKKKISIAIAVVVGILAMLFIVNTVQAFNLKKELKRGWSRAEGSIRCVLDFSDDEIEYSAKTSYSWMDTTLDTLDYKVISGNKMKVHYGEIWRTITVEFNDSKTMMTVKPALTSVKDEEHWFSY